MRVAISDIQADQLSAPVAQYFAGQNLPCEISCYSSIVEMIDALETERFDLALISLDPDVESAFFLARRLRDRDVRCELAFLSGRTDCMRASVAYRPIGYLRRPFSEKELSALLDRFLFYQTHPNLQYTLRTRDQAQHIPHVSIRYFRSDGHRVLIYTTHSDAPVPHQRKLADIERDLRGLNYLRCHQSYLVHLPFVRMLDHREMKLILSDGAAIPVSKRYFTHVVDCLLNQNRY